MSRTDPNALVVGPAGLAYDAKTDTLYVASTDDNTIFAIKNAGKRTTDDGHGHGHLHRAFRPPPARADRPDPGP